MRRLISKSQGLMLVCLLLTACSASAGDPAAGRQMYMQEVLGSSGAPGCITCHSLTPDEVKVGPSHARIGTVAEQRFTADDYKGQAQDANGFLRESILDPNAHITQGFEAGIMYQKYDQVLSEQQVDDLIAFLLEQR